MISVKSGTDFQNFSEIIIEQVPPEELSKLEIDEERIVHHEEVQTGKEYKYLLAKKSLLLTVIRHDVTLDDPVDPEIEAHVQEYDMKLHERMKRVVVHYLSLFSKCLNL